MATIITGDEKDYTSASSPYSLWLIALVGSALGALYWCLTAITEKYLIDPIFCKTTSEIATCMQSTAISGDVATILVAAIGIVVMVSLKMVRPLIIALSSGAVLWGLASMSSGLAWGEVIIWNIALYCLAYILFSWIARYSRIRNVLVTMLIIIVVARIALAF